MVHAGARAESELHSRHLLLYDGVCGLCSALVQFLLRHDHRGVFGFASLQGEVGRSIVARHGGNPDDLTSFYVVADYQTDAFRVFTRSSAALFVAGELGWPWKALGAARLVPTVARDRIYDFVARHRYRLFGRRDRCLVPAPHVRSRFVE